MEHLKLVGFENHISIAVKALQHEEVMQKRSGSKNYLGTLLNQLQVLENRTKRKIDNRRKQQKIHT
jgi:hypothetical protein